MLSRFTYFTKLRSVFDNVMKQCYYLFQAEPQLIFENKPAFYPTQYRLKSQCFPCFYSDFNSISNRLKYMGNSETHHSWPKRSNLLSWRVIRTLTLNLIGHLLVSFVFDQSECLVFVFLLTNQNGEIVYVCAYTN